MVTQKFGELLQKQDAYGVKCTLVSPVVVVGGQLGEFAADRPRSITTVSRFSLSLFRPIGLSVTQKFGGLLQNLDVAARLPVVVVGGYLGKFAAD